MLSFPCHAADSHRQGHLWHSFQVRHHVYHVPLHAIKRCDTTQACENFTDFACDLKSLNEGLSRLSGRKIVLCVNGVND